jgi:4-amino-4-deoxy-L-arabinose transferase-like glycosyltransferase
MQFSKSIKILALLLFVAFIVPNLISEGMFFDGTQYASISRNMAAGEGTFWLPKLSETLYPQFTEHPPLGFFIESLFFRIFGDHLWVEKIFTALTLLTTCFFIIRIWKRIAFKNSHDNKFSFLPVMLFISIPVAAWAYSNNMLENIQGMFTIAGIFIYLILLEKNDLSFGRKMLLWILISVLLAAAILVKGVNALFILAVPVLHFIIFHKRSVLKIIADILVPLFITSLIFVFILMDAAAYYSLHRYITGQFISTLSRGTGSEGHFYILSRFLSEAIIVIAFVVIMGIVAHIKKIKNNQQNVRWALFLLLTGLSAILPIIISTKQHGYYMLPGLPMIALSGAVFVLPFINRISENIENNKRKLWKTINVVLTAVLLISFSFMVFKNAGKTGRDAEIIQAAKMTGIHVPHGSTISVCPEMYENWSLHAYLQRYYRISLTDNSERNFLLMNDACGISNTADSTAVLVATEGTYRLYKQ